MWPLVVFEIICCVFLGFVSIANFIQAKKETDEKKKKNNKTCAWVTLIMTFVFACVVIFWFIPEAKNFEPIDTSNSSYSKKCELCEDRNATKGKYCTKCYNTLKGFQNTWG